MLGKDIPPHTSLTASFKCRSLVDHCGSGIVLCQVTWLFAGHPPPSQKTCKLCRVIVAREREKEKKMSDCFAWVRPHTKDASEFTCLPRVLNCNGAFVSQLHFPANVAHWTGASTVTNCGIVVSVQCQFSFLIAVNIECFLVVSDATCRNLVLLCFDTFSAAAVCTECAFKVLLFTHVVSAVPRKESYVNMRHNSNIWNTVIQRHVCISCRFDCVEHHICLSVRGGAASLVPFCFDKFRNL